MKTPSNVVAAALAAAVCLAAPAAAAGAPEGGSAVDLAGVRAGGERLRDARRSRLEEARLWWQRHTEGAPFTGRHRVMLLPERVELKLAGFLFQRFRSSAALDRDAALTARVRAVGARLAAVSGRPDWDWEVDVMDIGATGAFGVAGDGDKGYGLTGGKIGVLSGMLALGGDEAGLAAVLSHEMAHAVARHLGERISELILLDGGLTAAGAVVPGALAVAIPAIVPAAVDSARLVAAAQNLYGLGTGQGKRLLLKGFSDVQEEEADYIGMILMAQAGYDPGEAVEFWARVLAQTTQAPRPGLAGRISGFLALHPVSAQRVEKMRARLPEVRARYVRVAAAEAAR